MKIKNVNSGVTWDVKTTNPMMAISAIQQKFYQYMPYGPTLQPDGSYHIWGDYGATQVFMCENESARLKKIKHTEWMVTLAGNGKHSHVYYDAKTPEEARAAAEKDYIRLAPVVTVLDVRLPEAPDEDTPQIKGRDGSIYSVAVKGTGLADWDKTHADPIYPYYHSKSVEDAIDYALMERAESNRKRYWAFFKTMALR